MADTSEKKLIFLDDILGEGYESIEHKDGKLYCLNDHVVLLVSIGWPAYGLHFSKSTNTSYYLDILMNAAVNSNDAFGVYTRETMPQRWHFSNGPRVAPIYVVPKTGYVITDRQENGSGMGNGVRG